MASREPGFAYDIFISYRQKDNRSDQWVTNFVQALREELDATFKEEVSIYFDSNPHDGLLETHDVDGSLKEKIKCLVFIPIVSQTYCDPKSFAWQKEFLAFVDFAKTDSYGLDIKLSNGNVAKRVLPVRIHEIDESDKKLYEEIIGGVMRPVDFIYKSAGVNRPLGTNEIHPDDNLNRTVYKDQINKVANALKEVLNGMKAGVGASNHPGISKSTNETTRPKASKKWAIASVVVSLGLAVVLFLYFRSPSIRMDASQASIAVIPFLNNTGNPDIDWYGMGIANEIRTQLSISKQFDFISSMQATMGYRNSSEDPKVIGEKLGVTHILNGVYQQLNNETQVIVELVDAATGKIVWSIPYKSTVSDVGNLQASIAREVLTKFKANSNDVRAEAVNLEAFSEYTKGIQFENVNDTLALKHFEDAAEIDSTYLPAYAGRIRVLARRYFGNFPKSEVLRKEVDQCMQYVTTHFPDSWEKNEIIANYNYHVLVQYEEARKLYHKVLEENPDAEYANEYLGFIYKRYLKQSLALNYLKHALRLRNTPGRWGEIAIVYETRGEYDKAFAMNVHDTQHKDITYNMKYQLNDLASLPMEQRKTARYKMDSVKLLRNSANLELFLRTLRPDSTVDLDEIKANQLLAYYLQKKDDSVRFYINRWNITDENAKLLLGRLDIETMIKGFEVPADDRLAQTSFERLRMNVAMFAKDYPKATSLLKDLNKNFPEFGDYAWLNDPMYDRIKEEYPPFTEVIKNLKLPPKLEEVERMKM